MDLTNATVIGFFSLPSPSLAEHNPSAYNTAMAEAPRGAGSCQHCGTGILHHVIIRLADKSTAFIGQDCATRVGSPSVKRSIRERKTTEQIEQEEAERAIRCAEWDRKEAERLAALQVRFESLRDIIESLEAKGTDFHSSLASQLRIGTLSHRQAEFAVKAVMGCRYSKRIAEQWDAIYQRCVAEDSSNQHGASPAQPSPTDNESSLQHETESDS